MSQKEKEVKTLKKKIIIIKKLKQFNALIEKLKAKNIMLGQRTMELPEAYAVYYLFSVQFYKIIKKKTLEFDENNVLHAPLLIYYPEFQQTDFIQVNNIFNIFPIQ